MSIIPIEKLIEYKGNRYELSRAMIDLAKNGSNLLDAEVSQKEGKYVQVVIKNILDGNIKYAYEGDVMEVDKYAPFKEEDKTYDRDIYLVSLNAKDTQEKDKI